MFDFILPPEHPRPIIIIEDRGGKVSEYIKAARSYTAEDREVRIIGQCWSACSLALSVPNVCVGSMGVVMFHSAVNLQSGRVDRVGTKTILNMLPEKIRKRISKSIKKEFHAESTLNYRELTKMGVKKCTKEIE